ncbi:MULTISPECIES: hypothetical protein [unclassified Nostoc]|uniref:hypothetical protein n=1 Tax=unclassified Nostoc TaxID=2593658 RepID=UPI0013D32558|nr:MULTISPECIES: hypothetical protein [unclassified Nostoc]MBE8998170.1 hypothetical protein [Nostoc sp. LEGE 12447]NEU78759.1 hypothetical protein [Nostoc sp. UIC 10630]
MNKFNVLLNLQKYWQHFVIWMASGSDLQVWHESDWRGHISSWHAYDPMTGRSACFGSEEEMRIWIDKCYYR